MNMITIINNLFIIHFICIVIIDILNAPDGIINALRRIIFGIGVKEYHLNLCSLCCTFWLGLIYTICIGKISIIMIGIITLNSLLVLFTLPILKMIINKFNDMIAKIDKNE